MKNKILFGRTTEATRLPLYVTSAGYWEHQTEMVRLAGFPDYQLHQILDGQGKLRIRDNEYTIGPGDIFFLYPGVPHSYVPITDRWELAWVSFQGREASQMLSYAGVSGSGVSKLRAGTLMLELKQMLTMDDDNEVESDIERSKLLYSLLLDLKRLLLSPSNNDYEMEHIRPVQHYISKNLHRNLSLGELAEVASVSPQYLCRLFQKALKIRPMVYINQERINLSKKLMFREEGKKMYEIARMVGFENPSYFCVVFKRHMGMSPEDFKKMHGLN